MSCPLQRNGRRESCDTSTNNTNLEWTLACHHIIGTLCLMVYWSWKEYVEVAGFALAQDYRHFTPTFILIFY